MKLSTRSCLVALLVSSAQAYNVETHKSTLGFSDVTMDLSHENPDLFAAQSKIFTAGKVMHSKIEEIERADENIYERIHRRDTTGELQDHTADFAKISQAFKEIGSARTEIDNECSLVASFAKERDHDRFIAETNAICKSMQDIDDKSLYIIPFMEELTELNEKHDRWKDISENRANSAKALKNKAISQAAVYNVFSQLSTFKAALCKGEPVSHKLRKSIEPFKATVYDLCGNVEDLGSYAEYLGSVEFRPNSQS